MEEESAEGARNKELVVLKKTMGLVNNMLSGLKSGALEELKVRGTAFRQ